MSTEPVVLKPEDAARSLGISRSSLYELLSRDEIESIKIGRSRRIPIAAIDSYVARLVAEQTEDR